MEVDDVVKLQCEHFQLQFSSVTNTFETYKEGSLIQFIVDPYHMALGKVSVRDRIYYI